MAIRVAKVTLRCKYGEHAVVVKVYAYDPWEGTALVKVKLHDGREALGREEIHDLEAVLNDPQGTFVDVKEELRKRAQEVLPDEL